MGIMRKAAKTVGGKDIGPVGYGLMSTIALGLSMPWAPIAYPAATKILKAALDNGANFWNGGTFYGTPTNNSLHLLNHYFTTHPSDADKVVLSIKGSYDHTLGPQGSPSALRAAVDAALAILPPHIKKIDIFEMARVDPNTDVEISITALAELVEEGKIGGIGLSEVSARTIRRASAVCEIAAVEVEMSLFTREISENGVREVCEESYSPLSRGWLTSTYRTYTDIPAGDYRHRLPRFSERVFDTNVRLVNAVEQIAKRKGVTTAEIAIAWVVASGGIPIPGSKDVERVARNSRAGDLVLSEEEMEELEVLGEKFEIKGERYGGEHEKLLNA
ncbi:Aldo/keto reductase [Aureobasidium pullulans]|nr:Aldo/keto reductase [Aureobasidium pullulans]THZ51608.1 Aldo/keto reductase [Aureobasidium pullulans]THZ63323.1 Aldo/keto reductase [Aureobasidium pullulans]